MYMLGMQPMIQERNSRVRESHEFLVLISRELFT